VAAEEDVAKHAKEGGADDRRDDDEERADRAEDEACEVLAEALRGVEELDEW